MSSDRIAPEDEMALAASLPQADASSLVDREVLEAQVQDMYRQVAREEEAQLHFAVGRQLALRLGYPTSSSTRYPPRPWRPSPASATTSTSPRSHPETGCSTSEPAPEQMRSAPLSRSAPPEGWSESTSPTSNRQGDQAERSRPVHTGRVPRGEHRRPPLRGRRFRRRHLERGRQPLARQGPGLRRGGTRPSTRRTTRDRRHRQRQGAKGAHATQRRALGRLHRGGDPTPKLRGHDRSCRVSESEKCAPTTTTSSPSAPSTPAAPTASRASR